jgi:hypothetical protein
MRREEKRREEKRRKVMTRKGWRQVDDVGRTVD